MVLFIHKLWPTPLPTNTVTPSPLHTSLPARMYIMCTSFVSSAVFIYYFNCISFAIRLSGRKVTDWLTDWLSRFHISMIRGYLAVFSLNHRENTPYFYFWSIYPFFLTFSLAFLLINLLEVNIHYNYRTILTMRVSSRRRCRRSSFQAIYNLYCSDLKKFLRRTGQVT